jgi:LmbE family N-acetylglucosaminyl deacetylase
MGAHLSLAVATDGARGGAQTVGDLRGKRLRETTQALAPLGVPQCMGFPDGALRADAALEDALRALMV